MAQICLSKSLKEGVGYRHERSQEHQCEQTKNLLISAILDINNAG